MKKYYKTQEDFPVKSNCPQSDWMEISEQEYKQICKQRNEKLAEEQVKQEKANVKRS